MGAKPIVVLAERGTSFEDALTQNGLTEKVNFVTVGTGRGAVDLVRTNRRVKLAIIDSQLLDTDGERVVVAIKGLRPELPVVYVTHEPGEEEERRIRRHVHFYAARPVDAKMLTAIVTKAVDYDTRRLQRPSGVFA